MNTVAIVELNREEHHKIKGLWQGLNRMHGERSIHFKDFYASFTFENRSASLLGKTHLKIFAASDANGYVGYCIASMEKGVGEIDSLYIAPEYQKRGIGTRLMRHALHWFDEEGCTRRLVAVAEGNESVFEFYGKFGFYKRMTVLERKDER